MVKLSQEAAARGFPMGTVVDGRYRVARFIGQGGAGLVHEVEHVRTGRRLALKTLLDEAGYARLEQEAKATSLLRNAHAVKITDMGTATGVAAGAYMVMELLAGQSLRALLDDAGQLPVELTVNMALQVCECLAEAHGHGIIHRDLKPENVYLSPSPWPGQHDVRVLDFGVVKISGEGPIPHSSLTRTGSTVGTPYYMSLEQLRNSSAVDARADIYSLGVVMYECLSGRKPFEADTLGDLVYAICSGPPTQLSRLRPDAPAAVCEVVMRALSVNREDRQASMEDVAAALLPFGNIAFGLWIRPEARREAAAPRPARPAVEDRAAGAAEAPAIAEPPAVAMADAPAPHPAQAEAPNRVAALRPLAAAPVPRSGLAAPRPAAQEAGTAGIPRPRPATAPLDAATAAASEPAAAAAAAADQDEDDGHGRDTPTEMYTKARHSNADEPPAATDAAAAPANEVLAPIADRDTPTRAIAPKPAGDAAPELEGLAPPGHAAGGTEGEAAPMRSVVTPLADAYGQPVPPAAPPTPSLGDTGTTGLTQPTVRLPSSAPSSNYPQGALAPPDLQGALAPPDLRGALAPPDLRGALAPPDLRGALAPPDLRGALAPPDLRPLRPGWQRSLDQALMRVGGWLERVARSSASRFREASPAEQLALAIGGACLLAAILVLVLYMVLS